MLTRKLLYNGTSKLNFATFPAIQRCLSISTSFFPPNTFKCRLAMHSRQILGQQSRLDSRIQHEIRRAQSTDSHLLEAVGEDLLEEEKEEVTKLTSRFLHTGSMAHQVDHLIFCQKCQCVTYAGACPPAICQVRS